MSEALIFASTKPQCDDRLFIVHENFKLRIREEHVVYTNCCFCFDIHNNSGTQHVLQMLQASEIDLPVPTFSMFPDPYTMGWNIFWNGHFFIKVCFHKKCLQSLQYQFQCFTNVSRNLSCNKIRMLLQIEVSSLCQIQMAFSYL